MEANKRGLRGDYLNIIFLLFLYTLQAIPVGLAGSMTLLLQAKNIGYRKQALFSIVAWPFSCKILWAPVVDGLYSYRLGRRKSWLVPVQFSIGLFMLVLSMVIGDLMGERKVLTASEYRFRGKLASNRYDRKFDYSDKRHERLDLTITGDNDENIASKRDLQSNYERTLDTRPFKSNVNLVKLNDNSQVEKGNSLNRTETVMVKQHKSETRSEGVVDVEDKLKPREVRDKENNSRDDNNGGDVHIVVLTAAFLCLYFLAATQDICVDGWALTMLSRRNVGWASTCNAVGPAIGYSLGNPVFMALESAEFCNKYLRSTPSSIGVVTIDGFLYFWGVVFIVATTVILIFKKENSAVDFLADYNWRESVKKTYGHLYSVLNLRPVRELAFVYLTARVGFSTVDYVTGLKLVEHGLPKEQLALLSVPMIPLQILLPLCISRYTTGPEPMNLYLKAFPYRLLLNFVFTGAVWWTSYLWTPGGDYPNYYYLILILLYGLQQIGIYTMSVARTSLNARISDPGIGGSYMSLLTTFSNLGNSWPSTLSLYFVDSLTIRTSCHPSNACLPEEMCPHVCGSVIDGYYIECMISFILGFIWIKLVRKRIVTLQSLPLRAWTCAGR